MGIMPQNAQAAAVKATAKDASVLGGTIKAEEINGLPNSVVQVVPKGHRY